MHFCLTSALTGTCSLHLHLSSLVIHKVIFNILIRKTKCSVIAQCMIPDLRLYVAEQSTGCH